MSPKSDLLLEKLRYLADLELSEQADRDAQDLDAEEWTDHEAPPPFGC